MRRLLRPPKHLLALSLSVFFITATACKTKTEQASQANTAPPVATQASTPQTDAVANIDPSIVDRLKQEHWTGDLHGMVERRYTPPLVLYNNPTFFSDGPQPRGITYEALKEFEKFLNAKLNTADKPVHLIFIPLTPEEAFNRM